MQLLIPCPVIGPCGYGDFLLFNSLFNSGFRLFYYFYLCHHRLKRIFRQFFEIFAMLAIWEALADFPEFCYQLFSAILRVITA